MKAFVLLGLLGVASASQLHAVKAVKDVNVKKGDAKKGTAITEVVTMLKDMLDKSKSDGEEEATLFKEYKTYCDDNKAEKEKTVEETTTEIETLEGKIAGLRGVTGKTSIEAAQLRAEMSTNEEARAMAEEMRSKAHDNFVEEEKDLTAAIGQMGDAIDVLAEVGADQTAASSADHEKMMAGFEGASLMKLSSHVKQALIAANTFLKPAQRKKVSNFLQARAPFTGTYSSQSGEVVGILKGMKTTFESNLESAKAAEKAAQEAHDKLIATKKEEYDTMKGEYDKKQELLSNNDDDLATKTEQLETAKTSKKDAEEFLALLVPQCVDKTDEFNQRSALRAQEEEAIAKAVAILDSDLATASFGNVDATFLQVQAVQHHGGAALSQAAVRQQAQQLLTRAAQRSERVRRVAVLLRVGNPFDTVMGEIKKMQKVVKAEAKLDKKQLDWCTEERDSNNGNLDGKKEKITTLEGDIDSLVTAIEDPATGLKKQITDTQDSIVENHDGQVEATKIRREEHVAYTTNVANIVKAKTLLQKAVGILKDYYETLEDKIAAQAEKDGFLQKKKEEPAPPSTWEGDFSGQSEKGGGAIDLIEEILEETKAEEQAAHDAESGAQGDFEDAVKVLKEEEADLKGTLAETQKSLSDKELELEGKRNELDVTIKEKVAIERYLESIKPGCDFITDNYDKRETNRGEEEKAFEKVLGLLEGSAAYKAAKAADELASQGECAPKCEGSKRTHVQCEACLAGVSEPGYCTSHPDTNGC